MKEINVKFMEYFDQRQLLVFRAAILYAFISPHLTGYKVVLSSSAKPKPQLKLSFSFIPSFSPPTHTTGKVSKAPVKPKLKPQLVKLILIAKFS